MINNYTQNVGAVSNNTYWIISLDYYFDYATNLNFAYDNRLISINLNGLTNAIIISNTTSNNITTVRVSNWSDTSAGVRVLSFIVVANKLAALTTTVNCILYIL